MNNDDIFGILLKPVANVVGESEHLGQQRHVVVVDHEPETHIMMVVYT